MVDSKELIAFEDEIAELYKAGKIKAPIHLAGTNEDELITIFQHVKPEDWIFSTWRNHYHWLLSGRDKEELKRQIINNHSMHVFDNKFFTSAIVGGIAPIAVGVALALKKQGSKNKVWCFIGDMGATTGVAMESIRYASGHDLPVNFVIENNGLSVKTNTKEAWGELKVDKIIEYEYTRKYPHAGCGVFVLF